LVYYVTLTRAGSRPVRPLVPVGGAAIRRAEAMSRQETNAGAVAFSRRGDPNLGDFEDAVVLKTYGEVPDEFGYG
jgi:hypothetical protein